MDEMLKDARFAHIARDPKFRRIPKAERKVKIDHRFKGMFKDEKFTVKYTIDKRGRPINRTTTEDLRKYYDLSSSEDEDTSVQPSSSKTDSEKKAKDAKKKRKDKKSTREIESKIDFVKDFKKNKAENTSVSSSSKKDNEKKAKDTKEKRKDEKKPVKDIESKIVKDSSDKNEDEKNKDDSLSNKEDLSGIKTEESFEDESSNESSDSEDEFVQEEFSQADLDKNYKQLHEMRKDENCGLTDEIKKKLRDLTVDYARGEGVLLNSSDSSSEEELSETSGKILFIIYYVF